MIHCAVSSARLHLLAARIRQSLDAFHSTPTSSIIYVFDLTAILLRTAVIQMKPLLTRGMTGFTGYFVLPSRCKLIQIYPNITLRQILSKRFLHPLVLQVQHILGPLEWVLRTTPPNESMMPSLQYPVIPASEQVVTESLAESCLSFLWTLESANRGCSSNSDLAERHYTQVYKWLDVVINAAFIVADSRSPAYAHGRFDPDFVVSVSKFISILVLEIKLQ